VERKMSRMHAEHAVWGLALGLGLSFIGFDDWSQVHRMFLVTDLRLWLTFGVGVTLVGLGFAVLGKGRPFDPKPFHPGIIPGGILFGIGWALTGCCPSIVLVQLGEGRVLALATLAGVIAGTWLFTVLQPRYFRWATGSCEI
jgi:uncharacterized membrane protein YedE/YeeE